VTNYADVAKVIRVFEDTTSTSFVSLSQPKGFGSLAVKPGSNSTIWIEELSIDECTAVIPNDGVPFVCLGKKTLNCDFGRDKHHKNKRKFAEEKEKKAKGDHPHALKKRRTLEEGGGNGT
jgi:hypothetical protein